MQQTEYRNTEPQNSNDRTRDYKLLFGIWLLGAAIDRLWFALDGAVPSWDDADYLTGAMNYFQALQHPHWLSGEWWTQLWLLSSKIPPLTYIATTPFLNLFGTGVDRATLVHLLFSAVLLGSVWGLGSHLFDRRVGLWAAGLCVLFPGLYRMRLDFLLDYPVAAIVTLAFWCLTMWRDSQLPKPNPTQLPKSIATSYTFPIPPSPHPSIPPSPHPPSLHLSSWKWTIALGIVFGLAVMVKQTVVLFLAVPLLWVVAETVWQRHWERLFQLICASLVSVPIWMGWYRTNWLLVLTSSKRATVDSAIAEGDPSLSSLKAWTYYLERLPELISSPLLWVSLGGLVLSAAIALLTGKNKLPPRRDNAFRWLGIFWIGAYFLCSVNINKDWRYFLPALPVTALVLAYGLCSVQWRVRWGTVVVAALLGAINLFPFLPLQSWARTPHPVYLGEEWPHDRVIAEIARTEPYLRSTLGVLPSTPHINQHNFNYYGTLANFQVYGRQVGVQSSQVLQDARSLSWFLTKTGDPGSVPESYPEMVGAIEQNPEFELQRSWTLPDETILNLWHRRSPSVVVVKTGFRAGDEVELDRVEVPERVPPGFPVPVTYRWRGSWEALRSGVVLLTWKNTDTNLGNLPTGQWLHDRAIIQNPQPQNYISDNSLFTVTEIAAMLPPADVVPGTYTLEVTYLDRETGETYPIAAPQATVRIDPTATAIPAPELDWVTQLRQMGRMLPQGIAALDPVFAEVGRINQYDPIQAYLEQATIALEYRLQQEPENPQRREWAYAVGLARVLQKRVDKAIAAFDRVVDLDRENPYAYAYLAFVNLYDFRPGAARKAIESAMAIAPDLPELKLLRGAAALMQGNLVQAWRDARVLWEADLS
ncbi:MAG: phospholipid carrier-dependent glycosyltransferase [Cyanobacteriota bacterium]|nr:phospholipid carrier-dependent glycosyltransferase [Cyanobacteriota bacterium]